MEHQVLVGGTLSEDSFRGNHLSVSCNAKADITIARFSRAGTTLPSSMSSNRVHVDEARFSELADKVVVLTGKRASSPQTALLIT